MLSVPSKGSKSKGLKPRKLLYPMNDGDDSKSQRTISELFATSKQAITSREIDDLPGASPCKRIKTHHSKHELERSSAMPRATSGDMYDFSNPKTRQAIGPIDLTGSPTGSPAKGRIDSVRSTNNAPRTGPRKIVVRGLRKVSRSDPDEYYNRVWGQLDVALSAIFLGEILSYSMEELYRGVEIVCKQDRAAALYKKVREKCASQVSSRIKAPLASAAEVDSAVEVLREVVRAWSIWNKQLDIIRAIFFYLDRSYLLHSATLPSLQEMGINDFRIHIFSNPQLEGKILEGACDLVSANRKSNRTALDESLFQDAIQMFHSLAVYTSHFEPRLMEDSEQFFIDWTKQTISTNDLAGYVQMCGNLMQEECNRCDMYGLDQTTKKGLETYLEDILVDQEQARLVDLHDVEVLLSMDDPRAVSKLYSLLQRRRLGEKLRPAFEAYIVKKGSEIVFDEEREQEMVIRLLIFKKRLDSIWEQSFEHHEGLGHSLREAFESFINMTQRSNMTWGTDNPKPGEMIAKYVDMVLKGGTKAIRASGISASQDGAVKGGDNEDQEGSSEDEDVEIGKQLDQVLDLFRFVHGKLVFEAFYKRDLARRLLLGRSASADSEKSMLTRLKSGKLKMPHLPKVWLLITS